MDNTRCGACKFLGYEHCGTNCVFAPYFPPEKQKIFEQVDKIFGAEGIKRCLNNVDPSKREDVVSSLCYAAEARLHDPIFGCVGMLFHFGKELETLQKQINSVRDELEAIVGHDNVPPYYNIPIPDQFLSASSHHQMHDSHRAAGTSTSAGPSTTGGPSSSSVGSSSIARPSLT